jgi:acetyl-CoA acetyltransferase
MKDVAILGAGMTRFAKYEDRGLKDLSHEAVNEALKAAEIDKSDLNIAVVGNAAAGLTTGQECIRAQVILRSMGIDRIPMVNTENACGEDVHPRQGPYDVDVQRRCRCRRAAPDYGTTQATLRTEGGH